MKAYLITIGDEILIGQIIDTNSAWMGQQLNLNGMQVAGITTAPDEEQGIRAALQEGLSKADAVLITGGLGPTKDDVTKKVLAGFTGGRLLFHEETYRSITRFFEQLGRKPTEAHRLQAYMPDNAQLLRNRMGTAPGMWFEHGGKVLVSMPGVPYEMKSLMKEEVLPRLKAQFPLRAIAHRTLLTSGTGESRIAERIADLEDALPPHIKLAYLPNLGQVRLRLSGEGADLASLEQEVDSWAKRFRERLADIVFGEGSDRLQAAVGRLLQERGLFLATAESCTGGYVGHLITSVPGSSAYYTGGAVVYSNELKQKLLGVSPQTLSQHGAVSEEVVREMVAGTIEHIGGQVAIAISGIAGPGGGTPDKPVGTIWLAVGNRQVTEALLLRAGKDREKNIQYTGAHALHLLRQFLLRHYPQ